MDCTSEMIAMTMMSMNVSPPDRTTGRSYGETHSSNTETLWCDWFWYRCKTFLVDCDCEHECATCERKPNARTVHEGNSAEHNSGPRSDFYHLGHSKNH